MLDLSLLQAPTLEALKPDGASVYSRDQAPQSQVAPLGLLLLSS